MSKIDVIKIKQARRRLLSSLNMFYPQAAMLESVYRTVCGYDPTYGESIFAKDIVYLHDKGYIEYIDDLIGGADSFMAKVVKLTARGKEIAEQTMTDPALEI